MYRDIVLKQGQGFNAVFDNVVDSDLRAYRIVYHLDAPITGTLKIDVKRADGEHITDTEPFNGDLAYYVLKTNMYSRQGLSLVRVAITTPEGSIVTQHEIAITVLEPFGDTDISGDDRVPALSSLIIQATQAAGAANAAVDGANEALDRAEALTDPPRAADLIIAPPDALNPQRADIALTAEDDAAAIILDAVGELAQARESDDIAIVIEFLPGNITLADNTNLDFTGSGYTNLIIRGNGVRIEGTYNFAVRIIDSYIEKIHATARGGITATNSKIIDCYGRGFALGSLAAINSIIINCVSEKKEGDIGESVLILNNSISFNCTGSSPYNSYGINASDGSILTNCTGNSSTGYGIYATDSTLTNCLGNSNSGYGIYASAMTKKVLISNCRFVGNGLYYCDVYRVGGIDVEILQKINEGNITYVD